MPKASPIRTSFNAGELSPLLDGRVDVAKYQSGCREVENFIPSVQGPAIRRPGTRFVAEVKNSAQRTWLQRFEFSATQAYILEFGNNYVRFYTEHGQLATGTVSAYNASTAYEVGDLVSSGGVNYYSKQDHTGNAPPNATYWHPLTGTVYEVPTPYATADLIDAASNTFQLSIAQSGDVLYIAHPDFPLKKLSRFPSTAGGNPVWTLVDVEFKQGPFLTQNTNRNIKVYASNTTGNVTLKANSGIFKSGHVGALFYMEPEDFSSIKPWTAGQEYTGNPNGSLRRSDGKIYKCVTNATPGTVTISGTGYPAVFRTGPNKPIHTFGIQGDGDGSAIAQTVVTKQGLDWQFISPAYGWLQITAYTDSRTVSARVMGDYPLPSISVPTGTGAVKNISDVTSSSGKIRLTFSAAHGFSGSGVISVTFYYYASTPISTAIPNQQFKTFSSTSVTVSSVVSSTVIDTDIDTPDGFISKASVFGGISGTAFTTTSGSPTGESYRWAIGAFSPEEGYPERVTFFRERLTLAKGQKVYFSVVGDFANFASTDESGSVVPDKAINVSINTDQVNSIQWLAPTQALLIGTAGAEFACSENSANEAFAPGNVKIEQTSSEGSRTAQPVRVGYSVLFVQKSGRKLKELAYSFQQNGYVPADLSVLSEHITLGGITQMAWHKEPYVCAWGVRNDGVLLGFTFNREQDVVGWHRHILGGNGIVESIATIPHPDGDKDELWLIVRRTINGSTKRYVEYLEKGYQEGDSQADCFYVDCGLTYSGAPATTISGLSHLEGKTVQVLADGAAHPDRTVTSGAITLQLAASKVQVGLACPATLQTNRIEAGAGDGTAQGKTKRVNKCVIRFKETLGAFVGPNESNLDEIQFRTGSDDMDAPPALFTGDKLVEWPGGYDFDGYVMVKQQQPFPMTVVAIMPQVHTFDR